MRAIAFFVLTMAFVAVAGAAQKSISLVDARNHIDAIVNGEEKLSEVFGSLSPEDQKTFLGEINKAIDAFPGSVEEKTAKYLSLNHEALREAKKGKKGGISALLAEVFATVPPEALTVVNERFAVDLMNRAGDRNIVFTDEQYTKIALNLMKIVNDRVEETDNGSTRAAFAILMLVRASNGTPEDLADKLIETLKHEDARELAKAEWIPSALGKDERKLGYEPILASADAGRRPDFQYVLVIAGPQFHISILEDIVGKNTDEKSFIRTRTPVLDAVENPLEHAYPVFGADLFMGDTPLPPGPRPGHVSPQPYPVPEPHPY